MIEERISHNKPSGYSYFVATDFSGVYAGEYPMWTWSESQGREKLAQYLNFGIRCFLDLTMPGEMPHMNEPRGCRHLKHNHNLTIYSSLHQPVKKLSRG